MIVTTTEQSESGASSEFFRSWMVRRVAKELGSPEHEIDPNAGLMTLGVDSLALIGLAGELAELVNRELPAEILWEYETITAIADFLARETAGSAAGTAPTGANSNEAATNTYLSEAAQWSTTRAIQPNGSQPPLFLVHGVIGGVACYQQLSDALGPDQPVFGLQQPPEPPETFEQMASVLLDGMRTVQRKGPYQLGGFCFGGIIAFEIARQIEAMGEQVSLLAIFDAPPPKKTPRAPWRDRWARAQSAAYAALHGPLYLAREFHEAPKQVRGRFSRRFRRWSHRLQYRMGLTAEPVIEQLISELFNSPRDVHRKNVKALRDYQPQAYSGQLIYLQSAEFRCFHGTHPSQWRKLAAGGVQLRVIPGNHDVMLSAPSVQAVADQLKGFLTNGCKTL